MAGKNTAVYGIYRDTVALGGGLQSLRSAGFRNNIAKLPESDPFRFTSRGVVDIG